MNHLASTTRHAPNQNGLLAALPKADYERLSGSLELVPLPLGRAVYESGGQLDYVYFPTDCIVSLLSVTKDGSSAEIAIAGNEGLVGIALFMGGETTSSRAVVQNAGYAYRAPAALIKREFNRGGALQLLLLRYTQALITQMSQTAVCNRHHSLEQQLCRWLLLSVDRLPSNRLEMTEALIANMLGVPGAGVSAAAGMLQADGLIEYDRGAITVLDRPKLEQRACECYAVVKREFERLLHLPGRAEALPLSAFIHQHMDEIVAEWDAFARTLLPAAATMSSFALRDHAKPILEAIAQEIQRDPAVAQAPAALLEMTAATAHGALRHLSGFNLLQLGSEFRALRASVVKLWRSHLSKEHHGALDDLTRFNQSVDQALAESIASYADELARSRDTFLAILGHDLRSPLHRGVDVGTLPFEDGDARRQAGAAGRGTHPARRGEDGRHGQGPPGIHQNAARARDSDRAESLRHRAPVRGGDRGDEVGSSGARVPFRACPASSAALSTAPGWSRSSPTSSTTRCSTAPQDSPVILEARGRARSDQRAREELWSGDSGRRAAGDVQSPGPGPRAAAGTGGAALHQPRPRPFHRAPHRPGARRHARGRVFRSRRHHLHRPPSEN